MAMKKIVLNHIVSIETVDRELSLNYEWLPESSTGFIDRIHKGFKKVDGWIDGTSEKFIPIDEIESDGVLGKNEQYIAESGIFTKPHIILGLSNGESEVIYFNSEVNMANYAKELEMKLKSITLPQ